MNQNVHRSIEIANQLNLVRYERVKSLLSPIQQQLFDIIPYLIHHHNVQLPGSNSALTPFGISQFDMTPAMEQARHSLHLPSLDLQAAQPSAFEGVYSMGSTASFGQNPKSDVDVWLVYKSSLSHADLALVTEKTDQLTQWFASFDFEVNFYLVHPLQFRECSAFDNCYSSLGEEHSGSTQHWLLLEEFYRSHIRLSGKAAGWWPGADADNEVLFLGDVQSMPATEYFGASLWQLYKGLNKPHKALLKVLLLETYAAEYPQANFITQQIWQQCLQGDFAESNDAYLMLYQRIEAYLLGRRDTRRLEIVRRCFYLKCGVNLTNRCVARDWRRDKMQQLVEDWGWPHSLLETLDNSQHWHSGQLKWFNKQLNELLLISYRTLLDFASKQALSDRFRVEELGILARKLHTYFSDDEHQLLPLNKLWSGSIIEPNLTIIHSLKESRFYLYRQPHNSGQLLGESAIIKADTPTALIAWAVMNDISTADTQWQEYGRSKHRKARLTQLALSLNPLMTATSKVSKAELCQPFFYKKIIVVANLDKDPTIKWQGQEIMIDYMNSNVFSLGKKQQNMLSTIDIICLNSWGEWQCHRFKGPLGLLEALSFVAIGLKCKPEQVEINIVACAQRLKKQLHDALQGIFSQCVKYCYEARTFSGLMHPLQLGGHRYGLYFNPMGLVYNLLGDDAVKAGPIKVQRFKKPQLNAPAAIIKADPYGGIPNVIKLYISKGAKQYFLRQRPDVLDVFIIDEANELKHQLYENMSMQELVEKESHSFAFEQGVSSQHYFNMPQFFKLERINGELNVVPFGVMINELSSDF
ncbi:class I adenylate cyclase [Shewanella sp. 10N.286.48.B5]|uniref:class I adenylate cyclase n=1 Tax=Shewanella sp. 10N.286.48.B5 TaxID=1880834 RepID=UPI000CACDC82|nr:class I adenylate cyclase [Shewanella sp. 10N.286.48.B5]PMH84941.1 adenylate cyclase [Shewanella sp. 10N.286.48.B5]